LKEIKLTKSGEYMCSACKAAPHTGQYPRRWKWKTEKGFLGHSCYADEQKNKAESDAKYKKDQEERLASWISNAKYKVGDTVFYYDYTVSKPTHEWRGSRLVHVRYEEERSYYSSQGTITGFCIGGYTIGSFPWNISECNIRLTNDEVSKAANAAQCGYREGCDFASSVR
jgi:hypothetical protein